MEYNKPETAYYKLAENLKAVTDDLMREAQNSLKYYKIKKDTGMLDVDIDPAIFGYERATEEPQIIDHEVDENTTVEEIPIEDEIEMESSKPSIEEETQKDSSEPSIEDIVQKEISTQPIEEESQIGHIEQEKTTIEISMADESEKENNTHPDKENIVGEPSNEKQNEEAIKRTEEESSVKQDIIVKVLKSNKRRRNPDDEAVLKKKRVNQPTKRTLRSRSIIIQPVLSSAPKNPTPKLPTVKIPQMSMSTPPEQTSQQDPDAPPPKVKFIDGEIVWARVPKFPSHPAKVNHGLVEVILTVLL